MIAAMRAELVKVLRRRVLVIAALTTALFAVGSTAVVLAAAEPADRSGADRGVTVASLADAGGGTEVFTTAVSFAGTFLFVVFVGVVAVEFTRGTFRTMLLVQPRRLRLLAGKTAALVAVAAVVLAVAEVLTWASALVLAPAQGVATGRWLSVDALGQGIADYGSVLFWVTATRCSARPWPCSSAPSPSPWRSGSRGPARSSICCRTRGIRRVASSRVYCSRRSSPAARRRSAPRVRS